MIERCHQLALRIIQLLKLRLHRSLGLTKNFHFPPRPSVIAPNEIEGGGTNGGMKQGAVFDAEIASPESNKSVLHHVLGIGSAPDPLPGKQDQPGRELRKTDFPIFMSGDILHDPSRSLLLRRRQLLNLSVTQKLFLAGGICAISLKALAQPADPSAAREIAKIDGEYSSLSVAKRMPEASVEYFAEHGVAFAPGPVEGKKYWAGRTNFPGTLIWQPIFAFAAGAADLGYTTGIWELKKGNRFHSPLATMSPSGPSSATANGKSRSTLARKIRNHLSPLPACKCFHPMLPPARNRRRIPDAVYKRQNGSLVRRHRTASAKPFSITPQTTFVSIVKNRSPPSALLPPNS